MFDFDMLGLQPALNAALVRKGFSEPTPIQNQAIPLALEGHDIMGLAQTGTGKTLAFGLPLIEHLLTNPGKPRPRHTHALILAPTRELVNQIAEALRDLTTPQMKIKIGTVVGGQSIRSQISFLQRGVDVLVATPGRLIDLMDRGAVDLRDTRHLVLDEADQMLDMGFIQALRQIAPKLGTPRQTMLFSATMPKQMEELSRAYLLNPRRIQVAPPGKAADKVTQAVHYLPRAEKPRMLREILSSDLDSRALVFARTKHGAEKLMKQLVFDGYNAESIHGNKTQGQRDRAIRGFRNGDVKILVATDVAARGIDIPDVRFVINYDMPDAPASYIHRIGRTARAGKSGEAIALCSPDETDQMRQIEKLMDLDIPIASGERPRGPAQKRAVRRNGPPQGGRGRKPGADRAKYNGGGGGGGRYSDDQRRSNGGRSEGGRADGGRADGARNDGGRSDWNRDGARAEGGRNEGGRSEGARRDGGRPDKAWTNKNGANTNGANKGGGRPDKGRAEGGRPNGGPSAGRPKGNGGPNSGRPRKQRRTSAA